jgi:virginiamycin B lyase
MRRWWLLGAAAIVASTGSVEIATSPASARYTVDPPGSVGCQLSVTVSFSPPLTLSGGGYKPSVVTGTLSSCKADHNGVSIATSPINGSFARSPLSCRGLTSTMAPSALRIPWNGTYYDYNPPPPRAPIDPSQIHSDEVQVVTDAGGHLGLSVPGGGHASVVAGSFPNVEFTAYSLDTQAQLAAQCDTKATGGHGTGIRTLTLSGTLAAGIITYTDPSISFPFSITTGPDGTLWFANFQGGPNGRGSIGRITTAGVVTNYTDPTIDNPGAITTGPDGALWFANFSRGSPQGSIGRITTAGVVTNYTDPSISFPVAITTGPDRALWFINSGAKGSVGRITTAGVVTNYSDPMMNYPQGITTGPDGALWFADNGTLDKPGNVIGRITTAGVLTNYTDSTISGPDSITTGPDGALWFTNDDNGSIGRITTSGVVTNVPNVFPPSSLNNQTFTSSQITVGPDGALWFSWWVLVNTAGRTGAYGAIGRIGKGGAVVRFDSPSVNVPIAITAGPDGALWLGIINNRPIGRITP